MISSPAGAFTLFWRIPMSSTLYVRSGEMQTKRRTHSIKKVLEAYGGEEKFFVFFAAVKAHMKTVNMPETPTMEDASRVLHAHLMAERFLTRYLKSLKPRSRSIQNAGLSFSQKLDQIKPKDSSVSFLIPGLRRMDLIRNRLSGDFPKAVTEQDKKALFAVPLFKEVMDSTGCESEKMSEDAVSVLECFATFAGIILHNAADPDKRLLKYFS
jgi:hypothetical protein